MLVNFLLMCASVVALPHRNPDLAAEVRVLPHRGAQVSLAVLTDLIAHTLPLDWVTKVKLLAETDVDTRAQLLRQRLSDPLVTPLRELACAGNFPPDFSVN
jgi:hypothetical protein